MAFNYAKVANSTYNLIVRFGQGITLVRRTSGSYDPETGEVAVSEIAQLTVGVVLDYGTKNIDGTLIKAGDKQLLTPATTTPGVNDNAIIAGTSYTITMVKEVSPGGTPVLYDCNIRP